jgi:hypothetical protein
MDSDECYSAVRLGRGTALAARGRDFIFRDALDELFEISQGVATARCPPASDQDEAVQPVAVPGEL